MSLDKLIKLDPALFLQLVEFGVPFTCKLLEFSLVHLFHFSPLKSEIYFIWIKVLLLHAYLSGISLSYSRLRVSVLKFSGEHPRHLQDYKLHLPE